MPTPQQIQQSSLFINELYQKLEDDLLTNIGAKLATDSTVTADNVLDWQVAKLNQLGPLQTEQIATIAKASGKTPTEVKRWIYDIGIMSAREIEPGMANAIPGMALPAIESSNQILATLLIFEQNAIDTFNLVNTTLLNNSQQVYIESINKATAEVLTGLKTHSQALRDVGREWAQKGLPALVDRSGRRWSTEAYVNMVTRTISSQVAAKAQETRMDEYGVDLVEISSHSGSRPSHIEYQGRIYSRSGRAKRYPALSSTSYGRIDGIVTGINCTHVFYPYVQGKSIKRYQPYDREQSVKVYKESQKQRAIEREIRKAKKEVRMMEALKDQQGIAEANKNVREKQAKMRRFIDLTNRSRRYNREQIV